MGACEKIWTDDKKKVPRDTIMTVTFSNKWGMEKKVFAAHHTYTIALAQFIVIMVLLCLIRPKFILTQQSALHVAHVSLGRAIATSALITALTYFYPFVASL
jgi:hypothetical protein